MRASGNFGVSESGALRFLVNLHGPLKCVSRMFQRLPRSLLARQMILLAVLFGRTAMRVRRALMQFRSPLMILVMRSVVIARRHN